MRHFTILVALLLAACMAASSPIDLGRKLVNRPTLDIYGARIRRSEQFVKGKVSSTKTDFSDHPVQLAVHKGEYRCGNKVCKLKPGEKPPCDACQYPIY